MQSLPSQELADGLVSQGAVGGGSGEAGDDPGCPVTPDKL